MEHNTSLFNHRNTWNKYGGVLNLVRLWLVAGEEDYAKKNSNKGLNFLRVKNHPLVKPKSCYVEQSIFQ